MRLSGCFRILFLYDVAEAIDLEALGNLLGSRGAPVEHSFPRRTPQYIGFEQTPTIEPVGPVATGTGVKTSCTIKYYAFGVVVVQAEIQFDTDWHSLLHQGSRWLDEPEIGETARALAGEHLERVAAAVIKPTKEWLQETYLVTEIHQIHGMGEHHPTAAELLNTCGEEIAQLVRGELIPLSPKASEDARNASLSYYARDLIVIGSYAAIVYDRSEDAAAATQILEYAKMQLLEFRYYDRLMTGVLSDLYDALERKRNFLYSRWSLPRDVQHFNTIRLDVMELTERIDNSIKFVSDAYYARVYRLAAERIGLPDYRKLVDEKLDTTGDLSRFMVEQFNEARSFVLEVGVAILALLDVIFLFKGR